MLWKPASVAEQPIAETTHWAVYELERPSHGRTRHVVCYTDGEGRVSSRIITWDPVNRWAITRSGRKYHLKEDPFLPNLDALYVFEAWTRIHDVPTESIVDVSEEYE